MEHPATSQLDMFDEDAELSAIGVTRRQLVVWWDEDLLSFDPGVVDRFERWQYQEIAFLYHLTKVEPSVNAVRRFLTPLKRPYLIDHGRHFFNFKTGTWERRYQAQDLFDAAVLETPEDIGEIVRTLIRRLALAGSRVELFKALAVLREVISDEWLLDTHCPRSKL